jgi:hypothetical protein
VSDTKGLSAIFAAAKQLDAGICTISWDGFNLAGDKKSIDEAKRLIYRAGRLKELEALLQARDIKL